MKRLTILAGGLALAAAAAAPIACSEALRVQPYRIKTSKLEKPVRLLFLSDLHNCDYGPNGREIVQAARRLGPDLVLLGGDMAEMGRRHGRAMALVKALAAEWPCYYVSGNHEVWSGLLPRLKRMIRHYGATVLDGGCALAEARGQTLQMCGLDDPTDGREKHLRQATALAARRRSDVFSLLLAHRPEWGPWYATAGYDLILTGHAHGGQWRLPGCFDGFYAPDQGFFPAYAGGLHRLGGTALVVGRGLARSHVPVPRIFNRPELVLVDLVPQTGR